MNNVVLSVHGLVKIYGRRRVVDTDRRQARISNQCPRRIREDQGAGRGLADLG